MALLKLDLNPSKTDLRLFAGIWFPAFCAMVGWFLWRRHAPIAAYSIWSIAAIAAIAGLAVPATIRPIYILMVRVTFPVGWLMSYVVLAVAYFAVITPVGLLMRRFHDPMQRKFERSAKTYWIGWKATDRERYFRQM